MKRFKYARHWRKNDSAGCGDNNLVGGDTVMKMKWNDQLFDSDDYNKFYAQAQAGGMNETDSHDFALDQATRKAKETPVELQVQPLWFS